jgi:hypothetical protein
MINGQQLYQNPIFNKSEFLANYYEYDINTLKLLIKMVQFLENRNEQ